MCSLLAVFWLYLLGIQGGSKHSATSDTIATITSLRGGTSAAKSKSNSAPDIPRHTIDNCYIEFAGTRQVTAKHETFDRVTDIGPNQVLIKTVCSSISSGTEMKVSPVYFYV
jgi:hypothetical protein